MITYLNVLFQGEKSFGSVGWSMSTVDKMAELIEKRLNRIKTYIDDTKVAEPKFLNSIKCMETSRLSRR